MNEVIEKNEISLFFCHGFYFRFFDFSLNIFNFTLNFSDFIQYFI